MIPAVFNCGVVISALVSSDRDLLVLRKPRGVPIVTPIEFMRMARSP